MHLSHSKSFSSILEPQNFIILWLRTNFMRVNLPRELKKNS